MIAIPLALLMLLGTLGCAKKESSATIEPLPRSNEPTLPSGKGGTYKTGNPYKVSGQWYTPMREISAYDEIGTASWYGSDFHGKLTANGERYDMHMLSAAHKTMPLPTLVRVTNLNNGRTVVVRVNDRGPFVKNRIIDLSHAAAKTLGFSRQGTAKVRIQTLDQKPTTKKAESTSATVKTVAYTVASKPADNSGSVFVQVGAFSSKSNANRLRQLLLAQYPSIFLHTRQIVDQIFYRVRIGPFSDMQQVEETMVSLQKDGYSQAVAVIE